MWKVKVSVIADNHVVSVESNAKTCDLSTETDYLCKRLHVGDEGIKLASITMEKIK